MLSNILKKTIVFIGIMFLGLGISSIDSENLIIPITLVLIGALILKISSKLYIR